ncbi:RNA-binding protein 25 isoform X2 [Phalaenopsis equestris]|uniref:RNA-binding protein 25 isoform X2 n=1 Tax=Phalaenopsis equestris TaxID=78828 RepID=UPI0009E2D17D|nr:RNA-binding protein 25 isoform X2 [Phalaenopsis equestris]
MALASPSSAETLQLKLEKSDADIQLTTSITPPSLLASTADLSSTSVPAAAAASLDNSNANPNPSPNLYSNPGAGLNPTPAVITPPAAPSFTPSFRPLGVPSGPQYTTVPNLSIQPPGVAAPLVSVNPMMPGTMYHAPPGMTLASAPLSYGSNGYLSVPAHAPHAIPPPGVPRYPGPYPATIRPGFPFRPMSPFGAVPQVPRLPVLGVRPIPPMVTPIVRPVVPILPPTEKPQTTVYVGKIASTVDNDFLLSLLRICGPVKSWKRAQDPSDGKPKGFGFCEFEAAEGVLRALRLLSRLNIDGQELVLNINQATREYLERYVEKKTEREKEKLKETDDASVEGNEGMSSENEEPLKPAIDEEKRDTEDSGEKENQDIHKFGIVSDEDREADKDALEKVTNMIEERLKTNPLPPPPPIPAFIDGPAKSNSEVPSRSKDGDSDIDIMKSDAVEEKNDEETTSEKKPADHEKPDLSSPDRRRHDRRRDKDRERDLKREKVRELERFERERERERLKRERERESRIREAERLYKERMKDWEAREREREYQRQHEKDREKDRQRERRKEILGDEEGSDEDEDDSRRRRRRNSMLEERRRKRLREKEEDLIDRLNEEEEIVEAKKRKAEEQKANKNPEPKLPEVTKENEKPKIKEEEMIVGGGETAFEQDQGAVSVTAGDGIYRTNSSEMTAASAALPEIKQNDGPVRKLGFGLVGSGKRTTVPSVFHQEDDEDVDDKKMRPLVPIDYSNEELQAVKGNVSAATPNIVAAAEFAKQISTSTKEEKNENERERNGRSNDRLSRRDRDRSEYEGAYSRSEIKEKMHDKVAERDDKMKAENKKLLDAKQLIDMIPKTKEELFAYEINWSIYDKHALHERMRPWISKKITEFLGEEEATLVDYIVSSTKEHVRASKMLELLQSILDDEAEMFVLKMWRMLIFEVKKVETGLSVKSKA